MKIQIKSATEAEIDEIFFNKNTNKVSYKNKLGIITDLLSSSDIDEECLDGVENSFDYKMRIQPSSTNVRAYVTPEEIINDVQDNTLLLAPPFVRLSNGNVGSVIRCETQLKNGIFIYTIFDIETVDPISGVWVAMKQSESDPSKLEIVGELTMSSQYWNYGYIYIVNDPATPDSVKFIGNSAPFTETATLESAITTLTYSDGVLTATDEFFDYNGETAISLFNSLTGLSAVTISPNYVEPLYSGDSDYNSMMLGKDAGWVLYWDTSGLNYPLGASPYTWVIGYNIITGATKAFQPILDLANVTNFNPVDIEKSVFDAYSHPNGMLMFLDDQQTVTNGSSLEGVTAAWSSEWTNNTRCTYLNNRGFDYSYSNINGQYANVWGLPVTDIPVTSEYGYAFDSDPNNPTNLMIWRWKIDSNNLLNDYEFMVLPLVEVSSSPVVVLPFSTPNGMMIFALNAPLPPNFSEDFVNVFWADSSSSPVQFNWNGYLPTNFNDNKLIDTSGSSFGGSSTMSNWMTCGVIENAYSNIKF
jgi:hypothetical protein